MKRKTLCLAAFASVMLATSGQALASVVHVNFSGSGVSGTLALIYGTATDASYSNAYEITDVSGTFSDSNNGLDIIDENITSLVPINSAAPEPTNLLAPHDFSRFPVASGLSPESHGYLTYDNLFWPDGSPQTASDYPFGGGLFDIYGLLFNLSNGNVVGIWSDGIAAPGSSGDAYYGVAVATPDEALDYVSPGVSVSRDVAVPEPGSGLMLLTSLGLILLFGSGRLFRQRLDARTHSSRNR